MAFVSWSAKSFVFALITRGRFTIQTWCWVEKYIKHTPPMEITEGSSLSGQFVLYDCTSPFTNAGRKHITRSSTQKDNRPTFFSRHLMSSSSQAGLTVVPSWWGITVVHKSLCFLPCSKKSSSHALTWWAGLPSIATVAFRRPLSKGIVFILKIPEKHPQLSQGLPAYMVSTRRPSRLYGFSARSEWLSGKQ